MAKDRNEDKLDVINRPEKGERIVDVHCNVTLIHSSIHTICDNADRIKDIRNKSVCVESLSQSYQNEPCENYECESLTFLMHQK